MDIEENVSLSSLTTFRTGGPVRFLLSLDNVEEIHAAAAFAKEKSLPLIPVGGGSNMLAPDRGIEAVFVRLRSKNISVSEEGNFRVYTADAGVSWDELVARAVADGSWGLENLSAIPGTVGAAIVQNIGAYGAALSDTMYEVFAFDTTEGKIVTFTKDACAFGYRTSVFKQNADRYVIFSASFRLSAASAPNFSYKDLQNRFADSTPTLQEVRDAVIEIRKGKFPPLSEFGTAGSFFLNPVIAESDVAALRERYPDIPLFVLPEGGVKVPLAWLFDHVLHLKGMREGGAFVWEKQPLVLAAEFGATANDIRALAKKIAQMLYEKTNIVITPEVRVFTDEK